MTLLFISAQRCVVSEMRQLTQVQDWILIFTILINLCKTNTHNSVVFVFFHVFQIIQISFGHTIRLRQHGNLKMCILKKKDVLITVSVRDQYISSDVIFNFYLQCVRWPEPRVHKTGALSSPSC